MSNTERTSPAATFSDNTIPFVGQWRQLISTTNWEKGRIIQKWREAMEAAEADEADFTDEAWSVIVGSVTPQHVGRLRRVYVRFQDTFEEYQGLYWSHFCAAIDWEDAEMWLEGAVQNSWSVSQMRKQRWETLGSVAADEPQASDIVASEPAEESITEFDEDAASVDPQILDEAAVELVNPTVSDETEASDPSLAVFSSEEESFVPPVKPFAALAELPDDLATAFEDFKLAVLHHKMSGWKEISQSDVLGAIDSLRALALAPSGSSA